MTISAGSLGGDTSPAPALPGSEPPGDETWVASEAHAASPCPRAMDDASVTIDLEERLFMVSLAEPAGARRKTCSLIDIRNHCQRDRGLPREGATTGRGAMAPDRRALG